MSDDMYRLAKQICHEMGVPWTDPRTGQTYPPPEPPPPARPTVKPILRVHLDGPVRCPFCSGHLQPAFGIQVGDDGMRRAVIDETTAICEDCGELFAVETHHE